MEEFDEFELIPEEVAKEIHAKGRAEIFSTENGDVYIQCDHCGRWMGDNQMTYRDVLPCETGYDDDGFMIHGGGKIFACPECAVIRCPCQDKGEYFCPLE